jgi:hypothetical protein
VRFNGNSRPTTILSTTQATAQILASDIAQAASATVSISNPASAAGAASLPFTITSS